MEKVKPALYCTPLDFPRTSDACAIQAAVDAAKENKINVVVIPAKPDGKTWYLDKPVVLPSYFTLILSGCTVECEDVGFVNEHAQNAKTLATQCHKLFILGRKGAKISSVNPNCRHINIHNARDCRIAGITFEGGLCGVSVNHFQYSKLQMLRFDGCCHAISMGTGCNNIIMESVDAQTRKDAIVVKGESDQILARDPEICNNIFCRIRTKADQGAAICLDAGFHSMYNIVIRDLTDESVRSDASASVVIGSSHLGQIRDLTVRGVKSQGVCVFTGALCDGNFYSNLHPGQGCRALQTSNANTREFLEDKAMEMVLPQFREELPDRAFVAASEERFFGTGDADTVQNAVNFAAKEKIGCVVIPCFNPRTGKDLWDFEKAVRVPSDMTVIFLHSHIRHQDFMYENLFTNSRAYENEGRCIAHEEHDLNFSGVGDAVLDGGRQNGLKEKTCFLYGLPDKRPNATVLFNNVRRLVLENFQIRDSRWYGTYFIHCDTVRVSNIDLDNGEDFCNRDGVDIRQGNHNFLIENITGTTGDDTVALNNLGNDGNDGRYVEGKDVDTLNMVMRNIKSDAGRWFTVRLLCQDRHLEQHFTLDTIMDVSRRENQKRVDAVVMVGSHEYHYKIPAELGDLAHITIRDVYSRANYGVALGGFSDDVDISNVHTYADGLSVMGIRGAGLATLLPKVVAHVRDVRASGLFYKRESKELDPDMTMPKTLPVYALSFNGLETFNPIKISHVYADTAQMGVYLTGQAQVEMEDCHWKNIPKLALVGSNCELTIDEQDVEQTTQLPL